MSESEARFTTVAEVWDGNQALFIQSVLEGHGIEAFVLGEHAGNFTPSFSLMNAQVRGGIRVQVHTEDAEAARELLDREPAEDDDHALLFGADIVPEDAAPEEIEETPYCPACGSGLVNEGDSAMTFWILLVCMLVLVFLYPLLALFGIGLLVFLRYSIHTRDWTCDACGHQWKG